ncbi:MAG: mobile mystery protein A [Deltaproteobacteria bacterium]|nr:mobile mystery protein A [Deltaproteobacteria bacterium]
MRLNPRISQETRKRLDEHLPNWKSVNLAYRPRKGWIKAIREALGMSSRQLAIDMGKANSEILGMEQREEKGTISLQTLEKAALALHCRLVYALVPEADSLETLVHFRATQAAEKIVSATANSMSLEDQKVTGEKTKTQIMDLAFELEHKLDPRIWNQK